MEKIQRPIRDPFFCQFEVRVQYVNAKKAIECGVFEKIKPRNLWTPEADGTLDSARAEILPGGFSRNARANTIYYTRASQLKHDVPLLVRTSHEKIRKANIQ